MATKYTTQELGFIKQKASEGWNATKIAAASNFQFHDERPIRTAKSVEFALLEKLQLSKARFGRKCDVCKELFKTSWPQARYCGEICKAVVAREYANKEYRQNPVLHVQAQTIKKRERTAERKRLILLHFGDKCSKCLRKFPAVVYDLHHLNGKKSRKETPSRVVFSGTEAAFQKLLLETQLLCANCHRLLHSESNWAPLRGGL